MAGIVFAWELGGHTGHVTTLLPIFIFIQIIEVPAVVFLGLWFMPNDLNEIWRAVGGGR